MIADSTLFFSAAGVVGLALGAVVSYRTIVAAGVILFVIALGGQHASTSLPGMAALFETAVSQLPTFWAGVLLGAVPTALLRHLVGKRRSPAGRLAAASGPLRDEWRRWPHKSTPPTPDELRAFHDWLRINHPGLLVSGHVRIGVLELQDIVGMPKAGAPRR